MPMKKYAFCLHTGAFKSLTKHTATPTQTPWLIHDFLRDVIWWLFLPEAIVIAAQSYLYSCLRIYVNTHESDKSRVRNTELKYILSVIRGETLTHPSHNDTTDTALRAATAHLLHTISRIHSLKYCHAECT